MKNFDAIQSIFSSNERAAENLGRIASRLDEWKVDRARKAGALSHNILRSDTSPAVLVAATTEIAILDAKMVATDDALTDALRAFPGALKRFVELREAA